MPIHFRTLAIIGLIAYGVYWIINKPIVTPEETAIEAPEQQTTEKSNVNSSYADTIKALNLPDSELERCLINEFAEKSKKLSCHAYKIQSLEGIEALSELESVVIIGSDIQDATPLSRINSLQNIYLKGGNENIQNIDTLAQLTNLRKISFPHMLQTYCYEAEYVLSSMEANIEGNTSSNLNLVHCRGKKNYKVTSGLRKLKNGEPLTLEESNAVDDYEANLRWSN